MVLAKVGWVAGLLLPLAAFATPLVHEDSPLLRSLRQAVAQEQLADPLGPNPRATFRELRRWLALAGQPGPPAREGFWAEPFVDARLTLSGADEQFRPYSTALRHRSIAGGLAPSCWERHGLPCGPGAGLTGQLESAAGLGDWLTADLQLVLSGGNHDYARAAVDRVYLLAESDTFQAELGRDVLALGPEAHHALLWGDQPPPVDLVRGSTAGFVPLFSLDPKVLRISATLFLARLEAPQRFPGTLVSGQQLAFQLFRRLELSATRLLEFGGHGAPHLSFWEVLAEHVSRKTSGVAENYSNNRLQLGASVQLPGPTWPRVYYALVMEDTRDQVLDMLRYDSDHLVGLEWEALGPKREGALVLEVLQTGIRSGQHGIWTTGMTSGGFNLGSPLGPDARAVLFDTDWGLGAGRVGGSVMLARLSSDRYSDDGENIRRVQAGMPELRYRASVRMAWPWGAHAAVEASAFAEEIRNFAFLGGDSRLEVGGGVSLVWRGLGA